MILNKVFHQRDFNKLFNEIVKKEQFIDYAYLFMEPSKKNTHDFTMFRKLRPFFEEIYYGRRTIDAIERDQDIFVKKIEKLKKYGARSKENIKNNDIVLENARNIFNGREMIIYGFINKLFPLASGNYYE